MATARVKIDRFDDGGWLEHVLFILPLDWFPVSELQQGRSWPSIHQRGVWRTPASSSATAPLMNTADCHMRRLLTDKLSD